MNPMIINGVPIEWMLRIDANAGHWTELELLKTDSGFRCADDWRTIEVQFRPRAEYVDFVLRIQSPVAVRVGLFVRPTALTTSDAAFHVLPGFLFGDNMVNKVLYPERFPHLTHDMQELTSCSPCWECRADRCAMPLSALCSAHGCVAVAVDPYAVAVSAEPGDTQPVACGTAAALADEHGPALCGVTLGHANLPYSFQQQNQFRPTRQQRIFGGHCEGRLYASGSADRRTLHTFVRAEYARRRDCPETTTSIDTAIRGCADTMRDTLWSPEHGAPCNLYYDRNLGADPARKRPLAEIGWCGGPPMALPAIQAALRLKDDQLLQGYLAYCRRVPGLLNEASGFLYDNGMLGQPDVNGWWSGNESDRHWAYTNGSCVSDLLAIAEHLETAGRTVPQEWDDTVQRVLDTLLTCQLDDGNLGYAHSLERPEIMDPDGMGGAWFIPALALASKRTGKQDYLYAAKRALGYYHHHVKELLFWGGPMDTGKANDEEVVLGLIRGARVMHEITGNDRYLEILGDAIDYECLFRYGYRTRPLAPPLADIGWNSCGGSITSVSNPHIHPMGIRVSGDFRYYAQHTGDEVVRQRGEDGIQWALACLDLYPDVSRFGRYGMTTERYCPSDGLLIEPDPDGGCCAIWHSCHCFGVAGILEGLMSCDSIRDGNSV